MTGITPKTKEKTKLAVGYIPLGIGARTEVVAGALGCTVSLANRLLTLAKKDRLVICFPDRLQTPGRFRQGVRWFRYGDAPHEERIWHGGIPEKAYR